MRLGRFVLACTLLLASAASAAPLSFTGSQEIRFSSLGVSFSVNGAGVANATTGVSPASFTLPASVFTFGQAAAVTGAGTGTLGVFGTNASAAFAQGTGGFGGQMGLLGTLVRGFNVALTTSTPGGTATVTQFVQLPLSATVVGAGGVATSTVFAGTTFTATLVGAPFGTANVGTVSGFDARVGGVGTIQLVAPVTIRSPGLAGGEASGVVILNLAFVPEPATGLLCAMGAVGLGLIGRRRSSRQKSAP